MRNESNASFFSCHFRGVILLLFRMFCVFDDRTFANVFFRIHICEFSVFVHLILAVMGFRFANGRAFGGKEKTQPKIIIIFLMSEEKVWKKKSH